MIDIPWTASAALHLGEGAVVHLGTLRSCCQKFCESDAHKRAGAHVHCDTEFELHEALVGTDIKGVALYDLANVYITTFEPLRM